MRLADPLRRDAFRACTARGAGNQHRLIDAQRSRHAAKGLQAHAPGLLEVEDRILVAPSRAGQALLGPAALTTQSGYSGTNEINHAQNITTQL
jgi:hypothetical protein